MSARAGAATLKTAPARAAAAANPEILLKNAYPELPYDRPASGNTDALRAGPLAAASSPSKARANPGLLGNPR